MPATQYFYFSKGTIIKELFGPNSEGCNAAITVYIRTQIPKIPQAGESCFAVHMWCESVCFIVILLGPLHTVVLLIIKLL